MVWAHLKVDKWRTGIVRWLVYGKCRQIGWSSHMAGGSQKGFQLSCFDFESPW